MVENLFYPRIILVRHSNFRFYRNLDCFRAVFAKLPYNSQRTEPIAKNQREIQDCAIFWPWRKVLVGFFCFERYFSDQRSTDLRRLALAASKYSLASLPRPGLEPQCVRTWSPDSNQYTRPEGGATYQTERLSGSLAEEAREYGCGIFWSDAVLGFRAHLWV